MLEAEKERIFGCTWQLVAHTDDLARPGDFLPTTIIDEPILLTHTLAGEYVGLEEVNDGLWDVYFGPVKLRRMNERILRIEDPKGRTVRRGPPLTTTEPAD